MGLVRRNESWETQNYIWTSTYSVALNLLRLSSILFYCLASWWRRLLYFDRFRTLNPYLLYQPLFRRPGSRDPSEMDTDILPRSLCFPQTMLGIRLVPMPLSSRKTTAAWIVIEDPGLSKYIIVFRSMIINRIYEKEQRRPTPPLHGYWGSYLQFRIVSLISQATSFVSDENKYKIFAYHKALYLLVYSVLCIPFGVIAQCQPSGILRLSPARNTSRARTQAFHIVRF